MLKTKETDFETRVYFEVENGKGKKSQMYITIPKDGPVGNYPTINIPATGDMASDDMLEFM